MPVARPDNYQAGFARRWGHLRHARVRALAWLLDAPDLLDPHDPLWEGRIASVGPAAPETARWLAALDADPSRLDAALGPRPDTRLGLYAEKLMAFYFAEQGRLVAHGLQVRDGPKATIGEFDFLLDDGAGGPLEHIEFATKFYLLQGGVHGDLAASFDAFVGPNLADSLGRKMRKAFERQLRLAGHPAAQALLPRPVTVARALVKGWLFYPAGEYVAMRGTGAGHCRGFWCTQDQAAALDADRFVILPRLEWLAPFQSPSASWMLDKPQLPAALADHFATSDAPLLVALVDERAGHVTEFDRAFIVPTDWSTRASSRLTP